MAERVVEIAMHVDLKGVGATLEEAFQHMKEDLDVTLQDEEAVQRCFHVKYRHPDGTLWTCDEAPAGMVLVTVWHLEAMYVAIPAGALPDALETREDGRLIWSVRGSVRDKDFPMPDGSLVWLYRGCRWVPASATVRATITNKYKEDEQYRPAHPRDYAAAKLARP